MASPTGFHSSKTTLGAALDALWSRAHIGLREKALWRMLYATAARASEVLALDVEDLDVGRKRAAISGKAATGRSSCGTRRRHGSSPATWPAAAEGRSL